jgi:hypothetical protein
MFINIDFSDTEICLSDDEESPLRCVISLFIPFERVREADVHVCVYSKTRFSF